MLYLQKVVIIIPANRNTQPLAVILKKRNVTDQEIIIAVSKVKDIKGMTVNERLYVTGLMEEFDKSLIDNKSKARRILELLAVDKDSIEKIIK